MVQWGIKSEGRRLWGVGRTGGQDSAVAVKGRQRGMGQWDRTGMIMILKKGVKG